MRLLVVLSGGHVERAPRSEALALSGPDRALTFEVAQTQDVRRQLFRRRGAIPVIQRRKTFAGEFGKRGRFEPADAANREISAPFRVASELPRRRTDPARRVTEARGSLVKRERAVAVAERLLPVLRIAIAAGIDEPIKLAVRELELVDPEVR